MTTHEETTSSSKSHTTQSTQSPANSTASIATTPGSHLPALQSISLTDQDGLKPLPSDKIDPASFDLLAPPRAPRSQFSVEVKSELLLSVEHLRVIFDNPKHMQKFTDFLYALKPGSVPLLKYYLNLVKALRAIGYADAIIRELATMNKTPSSELPLAATITKSLTSRASETFGVLAQEELPAYVAHVWTRIVNLTIKQRITNTLPPNLRDLSEGLTDVFCLTDPSRDDNPVVFASEGMVPHGQEETRLLTARQSSIEPLNMEDDSPWAEIVASFRVLRLISTVYIDSGKCSSLAKNIASLY